MRAMPQKSSPKRAPKLSPDDLFRAAIESGDVDAVKKLIKDGNKPTQKVAERAADFSNKAHAITRQKKAGLFGMPNAKQVKQAEVESLAGFQMVEAMLAAGAPAPERLPSAANAGNTRLALLLIERGADVNCEPPMGTPLENAVKSGDLETMRALIKAGADVNYQKYFGPVLGRAVDTKDLAAAEELIRSGADVKMKPKGGPRVLMKAVEEGSADFVELFLRHGAEVDAKDGVSIGEFGEPEVRIEGGCRITHMENPEYVREVTPLIVAVRKGFTAIAGMLIAAKADVEAVDSNGLTAMSYAVKENNAEMVKLLSDAGARALRYSEGSREVAWIAAAKKGDCARLQELLAEGMDVNSKYSSSTEEEEGTALTHAAENGKLEAVKWLLDSGANVDEHCGNAGEDGKRTALMHAARGGHADVAQALIAAGASAVAKDKSRMTPLHYAAQAGSADVIRVLIQAKANIEAADRSGSRPLMEAAGKGHLEAVRVLLAAKADPNAQTKDDFTALFGAASEGHKEVVALLLEHGAAVSVPGSHFSPLQIASSSGHKAVVNLLLKAEKEQKVKTGKVAPPDGQAVISGVMSGNAAVVKSLLDAGADPNATMDSSGFSALMTAARIGSSEIATLLLHSGANVNAMNELRETALDIAYDRLQMARNQLAFLGKFADKDEQKETGKVRRQLNSPETTDDLIVLLSSAGGKRGKELEDVPAPKPKPEKEKAGDDSRNYADLPLPDFSERAKAAGFKKAVGDLETFCSAKSKAMSSEAGHPLTGCVQVQVTTELADKILAEHHEPFLKRGCYLVKSVRGYGSGKDTLALLPTDKRNEIFAAFGTNGANSDAFPADIVRWFDELEQTQPFLLTGAGHDWCEGRFTKPVVDSRKLAKAMYEFCPDIVTQGVGDVAKLALTLKKEQRFFFWWD